MSLDRIDYLLQARASERPEEVFLIEGDQSTSYSAADRSADRIAAWLRRSGVAAGDRVLLHSDNSRQFLLAVFGILRAGATVVPVHVQTPRTVLIEIFRSAEPILALVERQLFEVYQSITPCPVHIPLDVIASLPDEMPQPVDLAGPACIIYTSGSTGIPHGVVCGHREILFAIRAINQQLRQTPDDRVLCCLPFSFDYGLYQAFLVLEAGASLVVVSTQITPLIIPKLLRSYSITGFPLVPALAVALLRSRMLERMNRVRVRYVTNTGDLLPDRHINRLTEQLNGAAVVPMYGLTECKRVAIMPMDFLGTKLGSVGRPLPGTTVELLADPHLLGLGTDVGELLVRGPHVMGGYWREPEITARRFRRDPDSNDVTLHSGDLFRRDSDGFLFFLGRYETLIRTDNAIFSPAEIEQHLSTLDAVAEAAIVSCSGHTQGGGIHAFIVVDGQCEPVRHAAESTLTNLFGSGEAPVRIHFVPKLPRTLNGKISRTTLASVAERMQ